MRKNGRVIGNPSVFLLRLVELDAQSIVLRAHAGRQVSKLTRNDGVKK